MRGRSEPFCRCGELRALAWAQRITPFGYYSPLESINRVDVGNVVVLLAAAGVLLFVARWWVERRDLV